MLGKAYKFQNIYSKLSAPVKASLWFTVCSIVQKGITLLSMPIFTRLLTTEQYGEYSVYQSWYAIISIFATLNLSAGVLFNGLTKYEDDRDRIISSFQGLSTTVTGILFLVYLIFRKYWNSLLGLSTLLMVAMFVELLSVPAYAFWAVKQRYDYKYKVLIILTISVALVSPLLGVIAVLNTSYKAEARILTYVLIQVFQGFFFYVYNMKKGKSFFNREYWKFALMFNLPLIPHYLSMTILNQADRIMISRMIGTEEAAIYSVAYQISMMMTIVTTAINNSFVPYTYKEMKAKHYKSIKKNSNMLLVLIGIACIVAMCFGPEIIKIFAAKEYYDAIWVVPPVAASVYFIFLYSLFANIEFYFEQTRFVMVASCGGAVANLLLNYIFISKCGYYAAGYTTLACYILFSFAHYYFHKKVLSKHGEISVIYNTKFFFGFSLILCLFMIFMPMVYDYMFVRYGILCVIAIGLIIKGESILTIIRKMKKE